MNVHSELHPENPSVLVVIELFRSACLSPKAVGNVLQEPLAFLDGFVFLVRKMYFCAEGSVDEINGVGDYTPDRDELSERSGARSNMMSQSSKGRGTFYMPLT
jgi:hypothetical protein